jgi:type II secretory ATPase GspE/PulE/Tfp pilus assembly ATPase PilB-like protein
MSLPLFAYGPLVNRLKVMANLDIAKHPSQKGAMILQLSGQQTTARVTVTVLEAGLEEAMIELAERSQA